MGTPLTKFEDRESCIECDCTNYKYSMDKTLSGNGEASSLKIAAKGIFHTSTLFIGHAVS